MEESITPTERALVAKIQAMADLLTVGASQIDETILILQTYLSTITEKPIAKK